MTVLREAFNKMKAELTLVFLIVTIGLTAET